MKKYLFIISIFCLISWPTQAVVLQSYPVEYFNVHQMAMGGAGVASLQGAETVHTNPAGLVDSGTHFNFPLCPGLLTNGLFGLSDDALNTSAALGNALSLTDSDEEKANKKFKDLIPKSYSLLGSVPFGYSGTCPWQGLGSHWSLGGYETAWGDFQLLNPVSPYIQYRFKQDTVFNLSFARKIDDMRKIIPQLPGMKVGYTLKHISRRSSYDIDKDNEKGKLTLTDILNEDISYSYAETMGWGADIGFLGDADTWIGKGHWGLVFYNFGANLDGVSYRATDEEIEDGGSDVHLQVPVTARVGWSVENQFLNSILNNTFSFPTRMAIDYDLVYPTKSYAKRFHFGLEQYLTDWFSFQLGINQGFGTGGIQFQWAFYRISLAYFTEELGDEVGLDPRSYGLLNAGLLF
jgi:hypothetical protein